MDVASPLIEYVNSGRLMSMDEISEIIKVVRSADKYKADADRLAEALSEMLMRISELLVNEPDVANALSALAAHEGGE
jgi:hypothetical protein